MPVLDLFTVRVMTMLTVLLVSLATLFTWRINKSVTGMSWFAIGLLSLCLGSGLGMGAALRDSYGLMVASWSFRFAGMMMVVQSIRMFRGFAVWSPGLIAAFSAIVCILFSFWLLWRDDVILRTGVISTAMALLAADASFSLFRKVSGQDRSTHWGTGLIFAFVAIFLGGRGIADLLGGWRSASYSPVPAEIAATISANVAFIGCAFGMLLASNQRLRRAAERSALFDPLTGLPNRRFFEERLLQAEENARASGLPLGIIYIDLDDFKLVNDTLGHKAGDDLLRKACDAMARELRSSDCLARVGGDEFVVLVENIDHRSHLGILADRLMAAIENDHASGQSPVARASYGVAIYPDAGTSPQDVMREADAEMYRAKRRRRASRTAMGFDSGIHALADLQNELPPPLTRRAAGTQK